MKKIHSNKIRATFYIDKRLYQLLKRCSAVEEIPMSSIIENDILEKRVGKYDFPTPKDWSNYERYELPITMEEEENEKFWEFYSQTPEAVFDSAKAHIAKQIEGNKITAQKAELLLKEAEKKFNLACEKEKEEEEKREKEIFNRWVKAVKDFPIE